MAQRNEAPELQYPVAENVAVAVVENPPQPAPQAPPDLPAQDLQAAAPVVAQQQPQGELEVIDHGAFYTLLYLALRMYYLGVQTFSLVSVIWFVSCV